MNNSYLYSYLFTLIGGVLLVVLEGRAGLFEAITIIVGILFLVPGLLTFFRAAFPSKSARMTGDRPNPGLMTVAAAASAFGILLIVAPQLFADLVVYAFGALLIVCGLVQLANFSAKRRALGLSGWYLVTPVLCQAIGVVVIVTGAQKILNVLALITGIVLIVYGLNGLIGYYERRRLLKIAGPAGRI